jgi:hypothetical protein
VNYVKLQLQIEKVRDDATKTSFAWFTVFFELMVKNYHFNLQAEKVQYGVLQNECQNKTF